MNNTNKNVIKPKLCHKYNNNLDDDNLDDDNLDDNLDDDDLDDNKFYKKNNINHTNSKNMVFSSLNNSMSKWINNNNVNDITNNINKICLEYHLNKNGEINTILNKLKKCGFNVNFEYGNYQINDELGIIYAYK